MYPAIRKTLVTLVLSITILFLPNANIQASQAYTHTELTDKVDELFKQWDRSDSPGAALGIFKDGRIIYSRGYGIANLEYNIPITPQSVFRIASLSKHFTAICIAILAQQGKITIDDDIRKYLPEMPEYESPITIRHLLHHTSGLRAYWTLQQLAGREDVDYFYTHQDVVDLLSRQKELLFKSGDEYSYSNSGYVLLASIVARASGMKVSEFAKKNIFEPLSMNSTHIHEDVKMIVKNRATGYSPITGGGFRINIYHRDVIGDGGVFISIEDFLKWDQNFYNNKLGNDPQDLMNMVLTSGKLNNGSEMGYGFGLRIDKYRGLRTIGHGGSWVGFRTNYLQFPDHKFSIVILSNLSAFNPGDISRKIADLYLADQFTEAHAPTQQQRRPQESLPEPIILSSSQLREYSGKYYSDELDAVYNLTVENNNLVLKLGYSKSNLDAYSADNFGWGRGRSVMKIDFTRDKGKIITGFVLQAGRIKNMKFIKIK